jgi:hypothetical protein
MSQGGSRGDMRTQNALTGKQKKQKRPVVAEIQIAFNLLFVSLCKFPPLGENNRLFNEISRDRKQQSAAVVRKLPKVTSARAKRRLLQTAGHDAADPKAGQDVGGRS